MIIIINLKFIIKLRMLPYTPRKSQMFCINTNFDNNISKDFNLTKTDKL